MVYFVPSELVIHLHARQKLTRYESTKKPEPFQTVDIMQATFLNHNTTKLGLLTLSQNKVSQNKISHKRILPNHVKKTNSRGT